MSPGRRLSLGSLDGERWRRIARLMDQVLELDEQDVPADLERMCPDDPELRREVRALIEADAKARDFLSVPVGGLPRSSGGIAAAGTPDIAGFLFEEGTLTHVGEDDEKEDDPRTAAG